MTHTTTRLLGFLVFIMLPVAGCKDRGTDTSATAPTNDNNIMVYCNQCGTTAVIAISGDPENETWPKQCPSCGELSAHRADKCPSCGKVLELAKPSARNPYGIPEGCPHCGWTRGAP